MCTWTGLMSWDGNFPEYPAWPLIQVLPLLFPGKNWLAAGVELGRPSAAAPAQWCPRSLEVE